MSWKSSYKESNLAIVEAKNSDQLSIFNGLESFGQKTYKYSFILSDKVLGRFQEHDKRYDATKSLCYLIIYLLQWPVKTSIGNLFNDFNFKLNYITKNLRCGWLSIKNTFIKLLNLKIFRPF